MRIALKKHGNSLYLHIPKAVLELIGMKNPKAGDELDVTTNGKRLCIAPATVSGEKENKRCE